MSINLYEVMTKRIIAKLEEGVVPWQRPWRVDTPVNWKTQNPYRGINLLLLENGEYATFKQVTDAGGKVKKGEKAHPVVFWSWSESKDKLTGEIINIPTARMYNVFEINKQCKGLNSRRIIQTFDHHPITEAQKIFEEYRDRAALVIQTKPGQAYYQSAGDVVSMPPLADFQQREKYYSILFHELVHSTGHVKRLKRPGVVGPIVFGSAIYSTEELIAEIGASMLCGFAGIDNQTIDNSAAYVAAWIEKLQNNKLLIVQASAQAQKAVDYILGVNASLKVAPERGMEHVKKGNVQ